MAKFTYRARTADGQLTRGTLRAPNEQRASALLISHKLTPVEIKPTDEASFWNRTVLGSGIGARDMILFSRQTSSMIRAGVPILQAIQAMTRQVQKKSFRGLLVEMAYDVEAGESLSITMSKHPKTFSPFFLGVVRTGEASGRLSQTLGSLADHLEQDYVFMRKVRAALMYPAFILVVVILLVIVMFTYVLPQLTTLFADAGVVLPLPTRILIAITSFIQSYWLLLALIILAASFLVRSYIKTPEGRYTVSSYVLRLPIINQLFQKVYLARLTSILYTLFKSDVPALQSLELAREAVGNRVYQRILDDTVKAVKDGAAISTVWEFEPYIPPMLTAMVTVGEKSGNIAESFTEASRFFRRDVEDMLETIATLLEPLLIIILGIGVGIVVAAILLPIYNLVLVL